MNSNFMLSSHARVIFVIINTDVAYFLQLYIYFNGYDVHGSPHMFRVGSRSKKPRDSSSPSPAYARISSPGNNREKTICIFIIAN